LERRREGKNIEKIKNKKKFYVDLKIEQFTSNGSRIYKELEDIYVVS